MPKKIVPNSLFQVPEINIVAFTLRTTPEPSSGP